MKHQNICHSHFSICTSSPPPHRLSNAMTPRLSLFYRQFYMSVSIDLLPPPRFACLFIFSPNFLPLFSFHFFFFLISSLLHYFYVILPPFFLLLFFCYSIQCFFLLYFLYHSIPFVSLVNLLHSLSNRFCSLSFVTLPNISHALYDGHPLSLLSPINLPFISLSF